MSNLCNYSSYPVVMVYPYPIPSVSLRSILTAERKKEEITMLAHLWTVHEDGLATTGCKTSMGSIRLSTPLLVDEAQSSLWLTVTSRRNKGGGVGAEVRD